MDNLEFCNMLKEAKHISGKTNMDIIVAVRKSQGAISDMLNARGDYALERYLPYIDAVGFVLTLKKNDETVCIYTPQDIHNWVSRELSNAPQTSRKLGEILEVSQTTAVRIVNGGKLRLSIFLKLVNIYGYTIYLEAQDAQDILYI